MIDYSKIKTFSRTKLKPKHTGRKVAVAFVVAVIAFLGIAHVSALTSQQTTPTRTKTVVAPTVIKASAQKKEAPKLAENSSQAPASPQPLIDPNGCEPERYWRADNYECIDKPKVAPAPAPAPAAAPAIPAPAQVTSNPGSGDCASEIAKYNWTHSVALAVATAESGLRTDAVNNTPATGDYSIGCFQINIYGANAASRPSEAALKDAATNVAFAHGIYTRNGNSFLGQWGVCKTKVSCY